MTGRRRLRAGGGWLRRVLLRVRRSRPTWPQQVAANAEKPLSASAAFNPELDLPRAPDPAMTVPVVPGTEAPAPADGNPEDSLAAASDLEGFPPLTPQPQKLLPPWRWPWPTVRWRGVRLPGGLRPWITCMSLGFLMAALLSHGRQMRQYNLDLQGGLWLLLGVGCCLLSLVVSGLAWVVILRWLGLRPRPTPVVSLYILTNLRKFLPGGIWHLVSRVQALRQPNVALGTPATTATALLAVLIEPLLAATAALALVSLGGWQNGLGLLALLPLTLLAPRWLNPLLSRLQRAKASQLGLTATEPPVDAVATGQVTAYPWLPLLAQLVFVLLRFAGLACCVWAFDLQQTLPWLIWLSGFAFAWTLGLVVPGAPGGLGVFEAALLLRLSVVLAEPAVLAVALSYRLVATVADLLAAALVGLDERMSGLSSLEEPSA
ncbi:MAG: UPF0104 family protein [Cyanobacteriota bacterium]